VGRILTSLQVLKSKSRDEKAKENVFRLNPFLSFHVLFVLVFFPYFVAVKTRVCSFKWAVALMLNTQTCDKFEIIATTAIVQICWGYFRSLVQTRKHVVALNLLHFTLAGCGLPDRSFTSVNVHIRFPVRCSKSFCFVWINYYEKGSVPQDFFF
jgi:hypothetical protein